MAGVRFVKGSREWLMFQDYWKLCQKYWIPEDGDEYWESMDGELSEFCKQYEDVSLSKEITVAFVECMEKKFQENIGHNLLDRKFGKDQSGMNSEPGNIKG